MRSPSGRNAGEAAPPLSGRTTTGRNDDRTKGRAPLAEGTRGGRTVVLRSCRPVIDRPSLGESSPLLGRTTFDGRFRPSEVGCRKSESGRFHRGGVRGRALPSRFARGPGKARSRSAKEGRVDTRTLPACRLDLLNFPGFGRSTVCSGANLLARSLPDSDPGFNSVFALLSRASFPIRGRSGGMPLLFPLPEETEEILRGRASPPWRGAGKPAPRHGGRWKAPRRAPHKVFVNENTKRAVVFVNGDTKYRLFAIHVANFCPVGQKKERFLGHFACIFVLDMVVSFPFVNENTNSIFQFVNRNTKMG